MRTAARVALLEHSADILEREAKCIAACSMVDGVWPEDSADDRRDYDDMNLTARQLRNMAAELRGLHQLPAPGQAT